MVDGMSLPPNHVRRLALLVGIVSFFADMTNAAAVSPGEAGV